MTLKEESKVETKPSFNDVVKTSLEEQKVTLVNDEQPPQNPGISLKPSGGWSSGFGKNKKAEKSSAFGGFNKAFGGKVLNQSNLNKNLLPNEEQEHYEMEQGNYEVVQEPEQEQPQQKNKKLRTIIIIVCVALLVLVVILIVYSIFKNKRTQQSLLIKDSEITGLNNKIEDMNKIYSENMKQIQLQNQQLQEHINHMQNEYSQPQENEEQDNYYQDEDEEEEEELEEFKPVVKQEIQKKQKHSHGKKEHNKQKEQKEQEVQKMVEVENEYATEIPKFDDAPSPDKEPTQRLSKQSMLKLAASERLKKDQDMKQAAITQQETMREKELQEFNNEQQKISSELGLTREINEDKVKEILDEAKAEIKDIPEDDGMIDQSLIISTSQP